MSWELSLVVKATMLLGAAVVIAGWSTRMRASRRHLVVAAAFVAVAALPVASVIVPAVAVPLPLVPAVPDASGPSGLPASAPAGLSERMPESGVPAAVRPPASERLSEEERAPVAAAGDSGSTPTAGMVVGSLWLVGFGGLLLLSVVSLRSVRRMRRTSQPWPAGQRMADALSVDTGLNRAVSVSLHGRTDVPSTMGVLRPTILLPPDAPNWPESDLRRVLIHELEHVRRGDWWTLLLARAVCAFYWFHPLAWIAWRQLGVLAERACDDAVVAREDRTDYAEQLVALAGRLSMAPRLLLSIARRSDLSTRVNAILSTSQSRGRAGGAAALAIVGAVMLTGAAVASLQAVPSAAAPATTQLMPMQTVASAPEAIPGYRGHRLLGMLATGGGLTEVARKEPAVIGPRVDGASAETGAPVGPSSTAPTVTPPPVDAAPVPGQPIVPAPAPTPAQTTSSDSPPTPYEIGPDDLLRILMQGDSNASGDVVVRPDGRISLPLIGDIQAAGLTPTALQQAVTAALSRYWTNPLVTVQVKEVKSRNVFVIGQVVRPGAYPLRGPMTVLQLLATAGGLTDFARKDAVAIVRQVDGMTVSIPFDYAGVVSGQQLEQNIALAPGDTVVVR